jgi:hypothetical protein
MVIVICVEIKEQVSQHIQNNQRISIDEITPERASIMERSSVRMA